MAHPQTVYRSFVCCGGHPSYSEAPQAASFSRARPTPMRSAFPYCSRASASLNFVTPPVRRTGTETAALTFSDKEEK